MERKIGDRFECFDDVMEVVESDRKCNDCEFYESNSRGCCDDYTLDIINGCGQCLAENRSDGKNVIFKRANGETIQHTRVFIARDKSGLLWMFNRKPVRGETGWELEGGYQPNEVAHINDFIGLTDLSWEDEPLAVVIRQRRKFKYYEVDEEFELCGQRYKAVKCEVNSEGRKLGCRECVFFNDRDTCQIMSCHSSCRKDKNDVVFNKVGEVERKVGEVFRHNGDTFLVVPDNYNDGSICGGCYFSDKGKFCSADKKVFGECSFLERSDGKTVQFRDM